MKGENKQENSDRSPSLSCFRTYVPFVEAQIASPQSPEQRLCCSQEDLFELHLKRAMYEEQVGSDDQASSAARRAGQDAGGESLCQSEA